MASMAPNAWPGGKPPEYVHDYVRWLCTPVDERVPTTKAAYARDNNWSISTLKDWENDDRVKQLITISADKLNMGPERVQMVMNALFKKAAAGDTTAAKLYMEHVDKITPRKDPKADLSDLTAEELAELAALSAG